MPSGEANGLTLTRSRVRGHGKAFHGDRGARGFCDPVDVDTRHARICPKATTQIIQHQPLVHAMSRT